MFNLELRYYQKNAITDIKNALRVYRAPLYVGPTGMGKTVIFSYIIYHTAKKGNSAMVLVHRKELLKQASDQLTNIGVEHGIINPENKIPHNKINIASVQTLVRRLDQFKTPPNLLIVDEAQHQPSHTWCKIINHFYDSKLLSVTATPIRTDGQGLGMYSGGFNDILINGPSVSKLISEGFLVEPHVYAPPVPVNLTGLTKRIGDYVVTELDERINKAKITGKVVDHYNKYSKDKRAIAFCVSVDHAKNVANIFNKSGIHSEAIFGALSGSERDARLNRLKTGETLVLTSCDLIGEGLDVPDVVTGILLRPTCSEGLFLQQCGRCLRPAPGKFHAVILDHVGNCEKFGLPQEDREWSLKGLQHETVKKGPPVLLIRTCHKCFTVFKAFLDKCPACGELKKATKAEIKYEEGELERLKIGQKKKKLRIEVGMSRDLNALVELGKKRGYKNPWFWANCIIKSRQAKRK